MCLSVFISSIYPTFLRDGGGGGESHHFRILSSKLDPLMGFQNRPSWTPGSPPFHTQKANVTVQSLPVHRLEALYVEKPGV